MGRKLALALSATDLLFLAYWTLALASQVAGLMAVGYWALMGEFDPSWFLPNLALVAWPAFFLPGLVCDLSHPTGGEAA